MAVTDECAQYGRQPKRTQSKPVGRQRKRITYVRSELKIERAQGHILLRNREYVQDESATKGYV